MIITSHATIPLDWALRRSTKELRAMLHQETGMPVSGWEIRRRLRAAQARGYRFLPCCDQVTALGHCLGHTG